MGISESNDSLKGAVLYREGHLVACLGSMHEMPAACLPPAVTTKTCLVVAMFHGGGWGRITKSPWLRPTRKGPRPHQQPSRHSTRLGRLLLLPPSLKMKAPRPRVLQGTRFLPSPRSAGGKHLGRKNLENDLNKVYFLLFDLCMEGSFMHQTESSLGFISHKLKYVLQD